MMSRGQGDTKVCGRRQKAEAREAAMEAKQSGMSAMAIVGQATQIPLTRRACRSSMTEAADPRFSNARELCVPGVGGPAGATGPISPPWACGWGAANPASPNGSPGQRDRYR